MVQKKSLVAAVLSALMLLSGKGSMAQQLEVPSIADPKASPIDPASLQDAPAFGDSGPVQIEPKSRLEEAPPAAATSPAAEKADWKPKSRLEEAPPAAATSPAAENADWKPKFYVELTTLVDVMVTERAAADYGFPQLPEAAEKRTIQKIVREVKSFNTFLQCDDINVEANADESGKLTYSFACKGKAILKIDGSTITGSSISSSNGVLTISNGVIELGGQSIVTAEKLQLTLPVYGVKVATAGQQPVPGRAGEEFLQPVPDPEENGPLFPNGT